MPFGAMDFAMPFHLGGVGVKIHSIAATAVAAKFRMYMSMYNLIETLHAEVIDAMCLADLNESWPKHGLWDQPSI
eukprot:11477834-Karenia_brevis.AAC.1